MRSTAKLHARWENDALAKMPLPAAAPLDRPGFHHSGQARMCSARNQRACLPVHSGWGFRMAGGGMARSARSVSPGRGGAHAA